MSNDTYWQSVKPVMWIAVAIALLNMIATWAVVGLGADGILAGFPVLPSHPTGGAEVQPKDWLDANLALRSMANHHTMLVAALGVAFAIVSIGFALFVMGARGALEVQGDIPGDQRGTLVLKATAPGLVCFVLATTIVLSITQTRTSFDSSGSSSVSSDAAELAEALAAWRSRTEQASDPQDEPSVVDPSDDDGSDPVAEDCESLDNPRLRAACERRRKQGDEE